MFKKFLFFISLLSLSLSSSNADDQIKSEFIKPTIDIGCVVSDLDRSIKFYTDAIGFKVTGEFSVPGGFAKDSGLTNSKELNIKILTLGGSDGEDATKLKLMQVKGSGGKADHKTIDSTLGLSYITIFIKDTDKALAKLKEAGVKPIAKGPVTLPENLDPSLALTIVRDPDGNFVELVGPKSKK
ncbi:VOC family protein [Verrucomicrobia bacterium]|nr:VOC family protein [Verrucomicrobiota bacterium]